MVHKIKVLDVFADAIWSGEKTFEVRTNDRNYQKGDIVEFKVVYETALGARESLGHPLTGKRYQITYVLSGWGLKDGYVAFGIRLIQDGENTERRRRTNKDEPVD